MKLIELKKWINELPEEFMEYSVVSGVVGKFDEEEYYRIDKPITTLNVDERSKEICFLSDYEKKITKDEIEN